jgi:hypothetical protein
LIDESDGTGRWQFTTDARWLCCVPLLHFILGDSQPFIDLEPSSNFMTPEWWGCRDFLRRKDAFTTATLNKRHVMII